MKLYGNTKLVFLSGYRNLDEKKILMIKDTKPLTGIRVLDIACFIAAPYAATIMGEFGAEVIKVEHPNGGDPWRRYGARTNLPDQSLAWLNEAREAIKYLKVPGVGDVAVPNVFPTLSETPGTIDNLGPGLGDHNKGLYREELGLSESELQSLKESGVI